MPWRENKGVCQFKRILDGCFWLRERKKSFVEIFNEMLLRKKYLGEILFKMLLRKKYFRKITILLNRFLDRLGP